MTPAIHTITELEYLSANRLVRLLIPTIEEATPVEQVNDLLILAYRFATRHDIERIIDRATITLGTFELCLSCSKYLVSPQHNLPESDTLCPDCFDLLAKKG